MDEEAIASLPQIKIWHALVGPPSFEETGKVINVLLSGKALGPDAIPA